MTTGGADFGSVYLATDSTSCTKALQRALKRGINYVDTAPSYGDSEDRLEEVQTNHCHVPLYPE